MSINMNDDSQTDVCIDSRIKGLHATNATQMWDEHGAGWYRVSIPYGWPQGEFQWIESKHDLDGLVRDGTLLDQAFYERYRIFGSHMLEWGGNDDEPDSHLAD